MEEHVILSERLEDQLRAVEWARELIDVSAARRSHREMFLMNKDCRS